MPVDLGFAEKCEDWRLASRFFPSKVGGKPAWLDLKNIPGAKELQCNYCSEPCTFLCQVYAPYEDCDAAFHRSIYVFVCKRAECCRLNDNGNVKIFRSQLARVNPFYPAEPPTEEIDWRPDIDSKQWTKICQVCGAWAPNHCSKCKHTNYCSRVHQVHAWKHGHKESCGTNSSEDHKYLFPEYELVIETEDEKKNDETDCENNFEEDEDEIKKFEQMTESGEAGTFQDEDVQSDLLSMANQKEDTTFSEFRLAIDKYPEQVLRYNRGGQILYISSENKAKEVPQCSDCDGKRQFEFQIMPQLLNFLELGNALKCIDWGILAIFTCTNSCTPKDGYTREYVWKQDIINDDSENVEHANNWS